MTRRQITDNTIFNDVYDDTSSTLKTTAYTSDGTEIATKSGLLKNVICDSIVGTRCAGVSPNRNLEVSTSTRLVGTAFDGATLDTNFWTPTVTNDGTVVLNGEVNLKTNTTANGTAKIVSVRKGRFVVGSPMQFKAVCAWHSASDDDNLRRIGCYDANNGYFFQLDEDVFSIGTRTNSSGSAVDTLVSSGDFNGDVTTYAPSTTVHKCSIEYTATAVYFLIDGVLIHKVTLTHDNRPTTFTFPITAENNNDGNNATSVEFHIVGTAIYRIGQLTTNPKYYYHALGTTAGVNLKLTSGTLHTIIFNNVVNNAVITLSDSTTATTPTIFAHTAGSTKTEATSIDMGDLPFSTGLRLTVADANASLTIIYE